MVDPVTIHPFAAKLKSFSGRKNDFLTSRSNPPGGKFSNQFPGKLIFDNGQFVSIAVLKGVGASTGNDHAVDAISGGTITSRGVETMLRDCLTDYLPLIERERAAAAEATTTVSEPAPAASEQEANVQNE